jgi:hypothetical protein
VESQLRARSGALRPPAVGPSFWDRFEAEAGHDDAVTSASQWLDSLPSGLGAVALEQALAGQGGLSPTLTVHLRDAGLERWAELAASLASNDDGLEGLLGAALLFRAGLRVVAANGHDDFLDLAKAAFDPLLHSPYGSWEELVDNLTMMPSVLARLEAALGRLIEEGKIDPNRVASRPRPRELEPSPPTTQNLWSNAYATALVRHGWAYGAVRADPAAYTRLLHALPVGLAHTTVMLSSAFTPDELATLVGAAPGAFTAEGAPLATGVLYALLERAHQVLAKMDDAALEPAVARLVGAVLSRDDAPWLGRAWGQRVLWEVSHHKGTRTKAWPGLVFDALTKQIEPLSDEDSRRWIRGEKLDLWHVDRVLVEAAILLDRDRRAEAPPLLEWALVEGLVSATGRERALVPGSFESNLLGQIFEGEDLAAWFARVWTAGYPRRERHRIGTYRKIDDTAQSTLCWGLAVMNCVGGGRRAAWDAMFLALREIYLLDENYIWIGEVGPAIFRFAAVLCTALAKRGDLALDHMVAFLDLVVEPTLHFGGFIAHMVQQDEPLTLSAAMAHSPGQVKWALQNGLLAAAPGKSLLTPEALAWTKTFAAKLP